MSFSVDHLDPIIIERIVAGRNHDSTVKILRPCHIGYAWRRRNVKQIRICSGCRKSRNQRILEHVAASSGILSDHDLGLMILAIIPSKKPSHFECMFNRQYLIGFPAESICSKIFSHSNTSPSNHLPYLPIFLHYQHSHLYYYIFFLLYIQPKCKKITSKGAVTLSKALRPLLYSYLSLLC